jgi:NCS2 family nucleobase:cation symporter-2
VSLGFGMIPLIAPNFKQWLWHDIHPLIESGILLATISAVIMNAFFNGAQGTEEELKAAAATAEH